MGWNEFSSNETWETKGQQVGAQWAVALPSVCAAHTPARLAHLCTARWSTPILFATISRSLFYGPSFFLAFKGNHHLGSHCNIAKTCKTSHASMSFSHKKGANEHTFWFDKFQSIFCSNKNGNFSLWNIFEIKIYNRNNRVPSYMCRRYCKLTKFLSCA